MTQERPENTPVRFGLNLDEGTDAFFEETRDNGCISVAGIYE